MKVWERLTDLEKSLGYNREMAIEVCKVNSRCPATIEAKHHLIGGKRLENFCKLGCSVNCVNEYLDINISPH